MGGDEGNYGCDNPGCLQKILGSTVSNEKFDEKAMLIHKEMTATTNQIYTDMDKRRDKIVDDLKDTNDKAESAIKRPKWWQVLTLVGVTLGFTTGAYVYGEHVDEKSESRHNSQSSIQVEMKKDQDTFMAEMRTWKVSLDKKLDGYINEAKGIDKEQTDCMHENKEKIIVQDHMIKNLRRDLDRK